MPANVSESRLIAAPPALVRVVDVDLGVFLAGLPPPDFLTVADTKALWAAEADDTGAGTAESSSGTAYVVSAEVYKRAVKGRRYS